MAMKPRNRAGGVSRRAFVAATGVLGAIGAAGVSAHGGLGLVEPPRGVPALPLTLHDGRRTSLPVLLHGRITAMQLMFTGCSATCPVQGAVFASLQQRLGSTPLPNAALLSLSIDPLADDAHALDRWRRRFGAGQSWVAAAPPVPHAEVMLDFVSGRARGADRHNAQVFLFDARGRLAYRLAEFADPGAIAQAMVSLHARG